MVTETETGRTSEASRVSVPQEGEDRVAEVHVDVEGGQVVVEEEVGTEDRLQS